MQTNRSFLYGESVFSTAMLIQGKVLFLSDHLDRLQQGANFLWGPFSDQDLNSLRSRVLEGISQHSSKNGLRITLSYQDQDRSILRESFNVDAIRVDYLSFEKGVKKPLRLKSVKVADEQELLPPYLKSSRRVQETLTYFRNGYITSSESLLFCGPDEEVFETSWANLFAVKGNNLYTPPCGGSVLAGIMRKKILEFGAHQFGQVKEEVFDLHWLRNSDFVFATNALWGVIPIEKIDATNFNQPIESFFNFEKAIFDEEVRSKMSNV